LRGWWRIDAVLSNEDCVEVNNALVGGLLSGTKGEWREKNGEEA
jgi:hypothetical protein